jgi:segregation and condensation protein A
MAERPTRPSRSRDSNVAGADDVPRAEGEPNRSKAKGGAKEKPDDAPTVEALDPNFQLRLPTFEGPLDLLLHLIQKHELDILDLPIAFVVERYLEYLTVMENLDLDVASEYLVMAATLAHIKSKMLLPPDPSQVDEEAEAAEEIDPRAELIRRLLEYQKYKHAAEQLLARGVAGRDVFTRGMGAPEASGPAPLASIGLFKLLDAFQAVLKRANQELAFEITAEGVSIQDRMAVLTERLRGRRHSSFDELFEDVRSVYEVVVTFLAILEMAKRRLTRIYQADALAPIHLELLVTEVDESMVEGVDEYDGRGPQSATANDDEGLDESVARPGEDPLGEALDPEGERLHDAPPAPIEVDAGDEPQDDEE